MSQLGDLVACFEDSLSGLVTAVCVGESIVAAACGQSIAVYDVVRAADGISAPAIQSSVTLSTYSAPKCMRVIDAATLASIDSTNFIYIWALKNWHIPASGSSPASFTLAGCCAAVLCGHDGDVTGMATSPGKMFTSSSDGTICCWSTLGFDCYAQMKSSAGITAICCNEQVVCSADSSRIVKVWAASTGNCLKEISVGREVGNICCSSSTLFVAVARQICIPFSLNSYAAEQQMSLHSAAEDESPLAHMSSYCNIVTALGGAHAVALTAGGHMEPFHLDRVPVTCLHTAAGLVVVSHVEKNAVCVFHIEPFLAELTAQLQLPQAQYLENVRIANSKLAAVNKSLDVKVTSTGSGRISSVINVSGVFYIGHTDGCLQCFQRFSSHLTPHTWFRLLAMLPKLQLRHDKAPVHLTGPRGCVGVFGDGAAEGNRLHRHWQRGRLGQAVEPLRRAAPGRDRDRDRRQ
jgi:hypothetical protein